MCIRDRSFTVYYFYKEISGFTPVLSIRIVLDSFYLLIFYAEKFLTWIWRLLFAVNVNLNLSTVTQMTMHCVQIAVLSRVRDNNTESSKGSSHILGSFSNNDGHGYEDVTWKMKSRWFKLYALIQPRSVRQIMSNAGSFFRELNSKDGSEKESRRLEFKSATKREIRHFHVVVVQWRQKKMNKKAWCTCRVVV